LLVADVPRCNDVGASEFEEVSSAADWSATAQMAVAGSMRFAMAFFASL